MPQSHLAAHFASAAVLLGTWGFSITGGTPKWMVYSGKPEHKINVMILGVTPFIGHLRTTVSENRRHPKMATTFLDRPICYMCCIMLLYMMSIHKASSPCITYIMV